MKRLAAMPIVNPFTGTVRGDAQTSAYRFFDAVIEIHRWLLPDHSVGGVITGTAALLFLLLELTGAMIWIINVKRKNHLHITII